LFVSSPGDVGDERGVALQVIDGLGYEPGLRGRAEIEVVAWDRPGGGAPILATRTPQASIDEGLPRPSECDIVVVLFWSRMGTPLPHPQYKKPNGEPYQSGSEWEFEDALTGRPAVLLYRRLPMAPIDPDDPDADVRWRQARLVREFFQRLRDPATGAILRGHKEYRTTEEFRTELAADLRNLVGRLVARENEPAAAAAPAPLWEGSPFPGLRAFTPRDAPIYFGRGREVDELLARLATSRFLAVVGASGSGKSSLVGAGLLPRLAGGALPDVPGWLLPDHDPRTNQWNDLRITPGELGDNPFLALAVKLAPLIGGVPREIADDLEERPEWIVEYLGRTLIGEPPGTELLIFIDQFEELFTTVGSEHVEPFVSLLEAASNSPRCRAVVTMRSDFYHRCVDIPALAGLLEHGQFPLATPGDTLFDMIMRPAERAGLTFEEGLPGRILADTGRDPGALPLLAYTLDELYRNRGTSRTLSHATYESLGGVRGAIGTRAEDTFTNRLDQPTQSVFSQVFRELVEIDDQGLAARRRAPLSQVAVDAPTRRFVDVFTDARLLVRSAEPGQPPVVSVAHEALFTSWTRLTEWIELIRDDLRLLRRVRAAAREWDENGRAEAYLWQHERLEPVHEMVQRLNPELDPVLTEFIRPEYERLLPTFRKPTVEGYRRQAITDRLVAIGAPAIPGLLKALRSKHAAVRSSAASALARLGPAAIEGLLDAAGHTDTEIRLVAIGALSQIGGLRVLSAFTNALRDKDERVRSLATGVLAGMGTPAAANALTEAATDADVDVRWRAVGALGAFGEGAIRPLLRSLHDNDRRIRVDALAALQAIGPAHPDALLAALRDPDARLRVAATEVVTAMGPAMADGLTVALADRDADVRWRAAGALRACGGLQTVAALAVAADDENALVRLAAVEALGAIGSVDAVRSLVRALLDEDVDVAEAAARALAAIGAPAVMTLFDTALRHKGPAQARAARALSAAGPAGVDRLLSALDRSSQRPRAVQALAGCGAAAAPQVLFGLQSEVPQPRPRIPGPGPLNAMAVVLRAIGEAAVPGLAELAGDPAPAVRRAVAWALSGSRSDESRSALVRLLHDEDQDTRMAAARSLGSIGQPALRALFRTAQQPDPAARAAAGVALRMVGADAIPGLLRLAEGEDAEVRQFAVEVLTGIGTVQALFGLSELGLRGQPRK
jgi:HEAT repeat protein